MPIRVFNNVLNFMLKIFCKWVGLAIVLMPMTARAEINVAVIAPMAGEYQTLGREIINGARIAVDDINANGGLKGERVNLVTIDDQCNDLLAVSTAQMLAVNNSKSDKMNVVIGPYCPNSFAETAKVYAQANILQIVPTSISQQNGTPNYKGLVKLVGYSEQQGHDFFKYYQQNFSNQKVALVYDSRVSDAVTIMSSIENQFSQAHQMEMYRTFNFADYENDYRRIAKDIFNEGYGLAYILGAPEEIVDLSKRLKDKNNNFAVFINKYQTHDVYQTEMGHLAEGSYMMALPSLKDNPEFTETLVKLRLLGVEPEGLSVYSYSAVKLWEDLVDKSNSLAYQKLAEALTGNTFETAWGPISFNLGNPEKTISYGIYQLRDGEYTQVY